jgi:hypothetical protein
MRKSKYVADRRKNIRRVLTGEKNYRFQTVTGEKNYWFQTVTGEKNC